MEKRNGREGAREGVACLCGRNEGGRKEGWEENGPRYSIMNLTCFPREMSLSSQIMTALGDFKHR